MSDSPITLCVIFHGLISLIERPNDYRAVFVDMDGHDNLAGTWLNEQPIPRGATLQLTGISRPGQASLDPLKNLIVDIAPEIEQNLPSVFCDIILPKPTRTHSLFTRDVSGFLVDPEAIQPANVSRVRVFEYELAPADINIQLSGPAPWHTWIPTERLLRYQARHTSCLHLFASPRHLVPDDHEIEEFNKGFSMLDRPTVKLKEAVPLPIDVSEPLPVPGILFAELFDLVLREQTVTWLSQLLLNPEYSPAASAIGGHPALCGTGHGTVR